GDSPELENLYRRHVTMNFKVETGDIIQGKTLEAKVMEWLAKPTAQHPTLIVLGEFGDGKTVFSYILSRKLAEHFLESPSSGWLPVRFSLKDFSIEGVNSRRNFIRLRLEEFRADINGWNTLKESKYKLLAILDGFDEISKKLDHKTILKSINQIIECYRNEFSNIKLLITSRKHFFENQEHKDHLLQRIGNPELIQIAPIDRKTTEKHLLEYAKEIGEEEKFNKLKGCHDPIDLASKPLFLEMVKASLKKLPDKDLDELVLYETYIQQSLERKFDYLEDDNLVTALKKTIENMKIILEKVALKLHQSDAEFIYLSDVHDSPQLLKRLWEMSNPEDQTYDDEMGRIAVRSLLKRFGTGISEEGKQWPVDFCHRSMREYFVARAVSKMIEHFPEQSRQFLKNYDLSHEIVFFASKIMKKSGFDYTANLLQLIQATKYHIEGQKTNVGHLGSNAANLLYQYKGTLPENDWSHLVLDGVDFAGADLSGKNFSHTSFHYANLDNVNFTKANFSHCDLTGVRLEEASPVQAIAVSQDENIYALYNDGIIREWNYKRGHIPHSTNLAESQSINDVRLIAQPGNDLSAADNRQLIFYDRENNRLKQKAIINIKPDLNLLNASSNNILIIEEKGSQRFLQLIDLEEFAIIKSMEIGTFALCDHLGESAFIIYNKDQGLQIVDATPQKRDTIILAHSEDITCLATCPCKDSDDKYPIAAGQANGGVIILQVALDDWKVTPLFEYHCHQKSVTDIAFIDENRVVSGGHDKKLFLAQINRQTEPKYVPLEFKMHLQCKGMKIDGIKPDEKRALLETLIVNAAQME
ncbi:MAG: hypothetical protein QG657_2649, partial [Acidobacteriota bacterium]|nr:hypothetical protein [Acidobacteriota bacterium]